MFPAKAVLALLALAVTFGVVRLEHGHDPITGDNWVKLSVSDRTMQTARVVMAHALEATRAIQDDGAVPGPRVTEPDPRTAGR